MWKLFSVLCFALFLLAPPSFAADPQVIPLWNGVAPGSETWNWTEESNVSERDKTLNLRNIAHPTLTVYPADPAIAVGTGAIVAPRGRLRESRLRQRG
jgi:hypothetical protein